MVQPYGPNEKGPDMRTFIVAVTITLLTASAHAGLSTGPKHVEPVRPRAETNSVSVIKPAAKRAAAVKPVKTVKKKPAKRRRDDDDDRDDD